MKDGYVYKGVYITYDERRCKPSKAHWYDAGYDLRACIDEPVEVNFGDVVPIRTGARIMLPPGYVAFIRDRSGLAAKYGIHVLAGVIDPGYVGDLTAVLTKLKDDGKPFIVEPGMRIAQVVVMRLAEAEADVKVVSPATFWDIYDYFLEKTAADRGEKRFGSSGLF